MTERVDGSARRRSRLPGLRPQRARVGQGTLEYLIMVAAIAAMLILASSRSVRPALNQLLVGTGSGSVAPAIERVIDRETAVIRTIK